MEDSWQKMYDDEEDCGNGKAMLLLALRIRQCCQKLKVYFVGERKVTLTGAAAAVPSVAEGTLPSAAASVAASVVLLEKEHKS